MQKALMLFQFVAAGFQVGVVIWWAWESARFHKTRMKVDQVHYEFQRMMLESTRDAVNEALIYHEAHLEKLTCWAKLRGFTE